jgi:tetratricopeptide (TPR) repeat protein
MILGYIYTIQERYNEALLLFRGILDMGLESAQAYAAIGYIMDRQGNFKEAIMNLYRAIEIDPDNANAHNSLGYIFAESSLNLDEALKECKKAVSLDRDNPAYLDSLGWTYYRMGQKTQAKNYLKKALKMAPGNEDIREHLRMVTEASD